MLDFLILHWRIITIIALIIINIILTFIKKPKVLNTIFEVINSFVPTAINEAEKLYGNGNGVNKLNYATKYVSDYLAYRFNLSDKDLKQYQKLIQNEIEIVLSTPQKKEEK